MLRLILIPVALVIFTGCQHPTPQSKQSVPKPAVVFSPEPAASPTPTNLHLPAIAPAATPPTSAVVAPADAPKIEFDPTYDAKIKEVFQLANKNQWEEARAKSSGLLQSDPKNPMLQRLNTWVVQQGQKRRE